MNIANNTGVPLEFLDISVFWNHDGGNSTGALRLVQVTLEAPSFSTPLIIWSGDVYAPNYTILPDGLLLPTGSSTIRFTFNKNYQTQEGSERILIDFATNGCRDWPVDSNTTPTIP